MMDYIFIWRFLVELKIILLFEIGFRQGYKVKEIMEKFGFRNIEIIEDLNGNNRVIIGQKNS